MEEKTTRQIIREARRILRQPSKWQQGSLGAPNHSMCLLGGIAHAAGIDLGSNSVYAQLDKLPVITAIRDVLRKKDPGKYGWQYRGTSAVYEFNDLEATTQQDVVDLLTETLKSLPKE